MNEPTTKPDQQQKRNPRNVEDPDIESNDEEIPGRGIPSKGGDPDRGTYGAKR